MRNKIILALITFLTTIPSINMNAMQENQNVDINPMSEVEKESVLENEGLKQEEYKEIESKTNNSNQNEDIENIDKVKKQKIKEEDKEQNENTRKISVENMSDVSEDQEEAKKYDEIISEKNIKNIDSEIEEAKNKIDEIHDNINNLDITEARKTSKMLEPIKNRLKELKANNKEAVKLFWQSRDLMKLLRITSNLKQIEKENLKIENLIKENKSKTEVTKELKSKIEKINKIFENANNALKDDIMDCKNHIEKEGQNNTFYVDEFKILVKNLESAFEKYKKSKEKLDLLTEEISKSKVALEKSKEENKNKEKNIKNIDSEIEEAKNKINEIHNNINNLDITEARKTSKMLEPIKNRLKELKANNKEAVKLFWQSRNLINLLRITSNLKQVEKENLKIENLIKENKSKTEVTKELKSKIEKINKIFEGANNALKDDIMNCKNHIEKEGQNNTFYVDEFKILVKNLESAFGKYKKSKEKLDLLTKEIGKNKVELEKKYNEKINEIKDVLEQQNWDKYDAIKIEETIRELDYIKNAIISLKKEDKEARTTYYKANSLKKLLNAKKEYMNGVELDNEAANLRKTIESNSEKNIIDKDINEKIEKINKRIDEARVKISENNKECNKFISQKDKPYVYFAKEIKAQLNKLNDIDKSLQETKENLNKAPKTAINKILKNMENEAKYLKREYERLKEVYYDNDKDDEIYEEDLDDFYVDLEKFENDYKGNYENIKKLDKDSAETLRGIYKDARTKHLIEKF